MSNVPDLAEEIDRKAITELQRLMHALTTRTMGIVAVSAALQTLWEVTSGLVANETSTLIGESGTTVGRALISKHRPEDTAVFVSPVHFAVVQRLSDRVTVAMGAHASPTHVNGKTSTPGIEHPNPGQWCVEKFQSICSALGTSMTRVL